ncbi:hypothetical protein V1514DRAFT_320396 [Lipomyces japonicus]|uniref:uncharacterized protein n=1 Tax=Lipomyces japonicus TaxID=56871 RepID=UPI0034CE7FFB
MASDKTAAAPLFYIDDVVYTNRNNEIGVIQRTWHDTVRDYIDWDYDSFAGPAEIVSHYTRWGLPPKGWSLVAETQGKRLIPDSAIRLIDRALSPGDVCKRSPLDTQSGTIISASVTISLQHTLSNQVVHNVVGTDLNFYLTPDEGRLVYNKDSGVGEIDQVSMQLAVKFADDSIAWIPVVGEKPWVIVPTDADKTAPPGGIPPRHIMLPTGYIFPNQTVECPRQSIHNGMWIRTPSSNQPIDVHASNQIGQVLATKIGEFYINYLNSDLTLWSDPDVEYQFFADLDRSNWEIGDRVVFNDAALYAKYGVNEIGSERYAGFDLNVLIVTFVNTSVKVLWQNGSITEEFAKDLVPYEHMDEHDIWPGQYVGFKDRNQKSSVDPLDIELDFVKIGVTQSVNAKDRLAQVRWFNSVDDISPANLSAQSEDVSIYEIVPHSIINFEIGDYVFLPHCPFLHTNTNEDSERPSGIMSSFARAFLQQGNLQLQQIARSFLSLRSGQTTPERRPHASHASPAEHAPDAVTDASSHARSDVCDWFGQIVNINLDGTVTIRLGFLTPVKEIDYPASVVIRSHVNDDEEDEENVGYDEISSSEWGDLDDDEQEEIEVDDSVSDLQGNEVEINGNYDNSWISDRASSVNEEDHSSVSNDDDNSNNKGIVQDSKNVALSISPLADISGQESSNSQFLILESAPDASHHFLNFPEHKLDHRRLAKERQILEKSLPEGIYVRTYVGRLDLFRALIFGPAGTPYELAAFMFDFMIPSEFPNVSPNCFFHSWNTNGIGRVNPNLYEDGKVCLSLLGTWPGESSSENWRPESSSILQLLVSLQSLVLNKSPYFNEAGYDAIQGISTTTVNSQLYTERTFVLSRGFILYALQHGVAEFNQVIEDYYFGQNKLSETLAWERNVLDNSSTENQEELEDEGGRLVAADSDKSVTRVSKGAKILLEANYNSLRKIYEARNHGVLT